jgi:hypothetical protein
MRLAPGVRLGVSSLPREVGGVPGRAGGGGPAESPSSQRIVSRTSSNLLKTSSAANRSTRNPPRTSQAVRLRSYWTRASWLGPSISINSRAWKQAAPSPGLRPGTPPTLAGESLVRTDGRLPPEPVALKLLAA